MNRCILFAIFSFLSHTLLGQGVKVSEQPGNPEPSAIFEAESTTQGLLLPRMTEAQRNAIDNPAVGLQIFNTGSNCIDIYIPAGWVEICPEFRPKVRTIDVDQVHGKSALISGEVVNSGGSAVTSRGFCWGTSPLPELSSAHDVFGAGPGIYQGIIGPLAFGTTYYVRAFAENSAGIVYGNQLTLTTTQGTVVALIDVNESMWSRPSGVGYIDLLMVGGGGAGGGKIGSSQSNRGLGGGGAGGVVFRPGFSLMPLPDEISIAVGAGGEGVPASGNDGGDTQFGDLTAYGGAGALEDYCLEPLVCQANPGGCGAGGTRIDEGGLSIQSSSITGGFGNNGGSGIETCGPSTSPHGGGGGGAGGVGGNASASCVGGHGGIGLHQVTMSSITYNFAQIFGTSYGVISGGNVYFAGGGGGGSNLNSVSAVGGNGGLGGGGKGGILAENGFDASGYGAGGGGAGRTRDNTLRGGHGTQGIILLKY